MPRIAGASIPTYRKHRPTGQAVVTIGGVDHYLGPHGSLASRAEYDRLIAEWLANGRQATGNPDSDLTVAELIQSYQEHVEDYYVKRGRPTNRSVVPQSSLMKSIGQSESPKSAFASLIALAS